MFYTYSSTAFKSEDQELLVNMIKELGFGMLISHDNQDVYTSHLPIAIYKKEGCYFIEAHLALQNEHRNHLLNTQTMMMFSCANHYISPSFYPQKAINGKVVPTWNYCVINVLVEPSLLSLDALKNHLAMMTDHNESTLESPWDVNDAPADYTEKLMNHIQGIRLKVIRLEGIFKLSQNKRATEFQGVLAGLEHTDSTSAKQIARYMKNI